MGDTVDDVAGRLRKIAVELVRSGRAADAAAVLTSIGAVEMLSMFGEDAAPTGPGPQPAHSPGYWLSHRRARRAAVAAVTVVDVTERSVPELSVAESSVPELSVAEGSVPELSVAEGSVPELSVAEGSDPDNSNRAQLIRLIRELEPGHRLNDDGDQVMLNVVRQLIFHTVWLAEELRVAQEEIDRLSDGNQWVDRTLSGVKRPP
jgi:hypothetical protein